MKKKKSLSGYWFYLAGQDELSPEEVISLFFKGEIKTKMVLPGNWQLRGLDNYSGAVWFIRKFSLDYSHQSDVILEFQGVDYFTDVWLNRNYIGSHEGYFQKFSFNVSESINRNGENILIVKVTSPREEPGKVWPYRKKLIKGIFNHHDCRPGGWSSQYGQDMNTGGIWNDVNVYQINKVYLHAIRIIPLLYNNYTCSKITILCLCECYSDTPVHEEINIKIKTPSGKTLETQHTIRLSKDDSSFLIHTEIDHPDLWWTWDLGKQNLYKLTISGKYIPETKETFGIREVKLDENKFFYLNGRRLFLRGTNIIPSQFMSELQRNKISQQVTWLKEANINIARMHAHINREEYYDECNRKGILVWQDFPLQWTYDESDTFRENAVRQVKDMVTGLSNHPSIAFWCCHNEPGNQIETLDPALYSAISELDNTRIIRLASNYEEHPYDGWYWGNKEHFAARPMGPLVTEFGAQALPELKSLKNFIPAGKIDPPDWDKWNYHNFQYEQTFLVAEISRGKNIKEFISNSQTYQADLIKTAVDFYRRGKNKDITGIFQFMFIDCWPSITWSVIDYYGFKKPGYFAIQTSFQPLYISIELKQKKYFKGRKLNIDVWIINDLYEKFSNCIIKFILRNSEIGSVDIDEIGANCIFTVDLNNSPVNLPGKLKAGKYLIKAELRCKKKKEALSYNSFLIDVVENY